MAICSFGGIKDLEGVKLLEDFRSATYLPVGFGFRPTDTELVSYYLNGKINGSLRPIDEFMIPEIDVYRCDPWDAVGKSLFQSGDPVWYFFSPKNSKFPGGRRHNRATSSGSWKLTGTDREITELSGSITGKKRTLIFYQHACTRTVWTIHEYTTTKEQVDYLNNDLSPLLYPECGILGPDGNHFDYLHEILQPFPTESFDQELLLKMTQNDNMDQTTHADCTNFDDFFSEI